MLLLLTMMSICNLDINNSDNSGSDYIYSDTSNFQRSFLNYLGEHPMKCIIKSLLGFDSFTHESNDLCTPLPPIIKSLFSSVIFIILITIANHLLRT